MSRFRMRARSADIPMRQVSGILLCMMAVSASLGMLVPLLAVSLAGMGISSTLIGFNAATPALAGLVATPLLPYLLAWVGARRFMLGCLAVGILCTLAYGWTFNVWAWFPLRFLNGVAIGGLFLVAEIWLNAIAQEEWRGRLIGIYATAAALGFAAGPVLLALVGWEGFAPFLAVCAVFVPACASLLLFPREIPEALGNSPAKVAPGLLLLLPSAFAAVLVFGALEEQGISLLVIYTLRVGSAAQDSIYAVAAFAGGGAFGPMLIGALADKWERRATLLLCTLGACACLGLLPFSVGVPALFFAVLMFFGGLVAGLYTISLTLIGATFRGGDLTAANALLLMLYSSGALLGPVLGGVSMDVWNPHGLIVSMLILLGGYGALLSLRIALRARGRR